MKDIFARRVENLEDTKELAYEFASMLKPGEIVLLFGGLGAGKTTFTKFLAQALGFDGLVNSPTFTLMNEYDAEKMKIYHFDMYRVSSGAEAEEFGFREVLNAGDGVVIIEWPENVEDVLPKTGCIHMYIDVIDENSREFVCRREE